MSKIARVILWPGTKMCHKLGIDPESDMGLMRSFFNFMFWLPIGLVISLAFIE